MVLACFWLALLHHAMPLSGNSPDAWRGNPVRFSRLDNQRLLREELDKRQGGERPAFAVARVADLRPDRSGEWSEDGVDGLLRWRLHIQSPGALSLNLGITEFYLPPGAKCWLSGVGGLKIEGPFTYADNEEHGQFWTPVIEGEEVVLEIALPPDEKANLRCRVAYVNHDFLGFSRLISGNCHLDVACGSQDGWKWVDHYREQVASVGMYTINGRNFCTGALINYTGTVCRPFFLSAFHCDVTANSAPSVVVYWRYQHSVCRVPLSQVNGGTGDGKKTLFNSGAFFRAGFSPSDFILLELDDPIPPSAEPYYAGWDATPRVPGDTLVSIHHPNTAEKRISISFRAPYRGQWGQLAREVSDGNHLIVPQWDVGSTEDGSSGAPLLNREKLIVGQLHGGAASCQTNAFDAFGWFPSSWTGGGSPINRLSEWLDPDNKGIRKLAGRSGVLCGKGLQASASRLILCAPQSGNLQVSAGQGFSGPVSLDLTGLPAFISYTFLPGLVAPGETSLLTLTVDSLPSITGDLKFHVRGISGADTIILPLVLELSRIPDQVALAGAIIGKDPEILLRWFSLNGQPEYQLELAADSLFARNLFTIQTRDTFRQITNLEYGTTYYYRLQAVNACGRSPRMSKGVFSTAPDLQLRVTDLNRELCSAADLKAGIRWGRGFSGPVQVAAVLSPPILGWTFILQKTGDFTADLRAEAPLDSLKPGDYSLGVTVSNGNFRSEASTPFRLRGWPAKPKLQTPEPNEVLLTPRPQLNWKADSLADNFSIRIGRDSLLQQPLFTGERNTSFYKLATDLDSGSYFWQVKAANDCGERISEVRRFRLNLQNLGTLFKWQIAVEPNPVSVQVNVHLSERIGPITLSLSDMWGRLLRTQTFPGEGNHFSLPTLDLPAGMYFLRVSYRQGSYSHLIVKTAP